MLLAFVVPQALPPYPYAPQSALYLGTTNGVVAPQLPTFLKALTPDDSARLAAWLAAGTNSAVYNFTNREVCTVILFPFVRISELAAGKPAHTAPLLNVPDFSGIRVEPGGVTQLLIPIPTESGTWEPHFSYTLHSCSSTYPGYLKYKDLPQSLLCLLTGNSFHVSTLPITVSKLISSPSSGTETNSVK